VLGAVLVDNAAFNSAAEVLARDDFYRESHRRIFDAMAALAERSQPIDLVTLKDELIRGSALEAVGGAAYLASLVDGVPRITSVEQWSRIIKEKAVLRNLIHAGNRIVHSAFEAEEEAGVILDKAEKAIFDIAEHRIRQGFVGIREIVKESFRTIDQLSQSKELVTGLPTGFVDLDEKTSGLQKGDLIIVAARPAMGKTSFCLNVAQYASAKTGETVGIFSLEMAKEQLVLRMLCADARVDAHRLRTGNLQEKDWARLAKAYADLSASKIFIDDSATLTPLEMRAKCRRLKAEHGLGLILVDYLQLVSGAGRIENRQQEIASISRSLKGLAKELSVPVVALSQLSRAPEGRTEKRPQLSDLRECVTGETLVVMADGQRAKRQGMARREAAGLSRQARQRAHHPGHAAAPALGAGGLDAAAAPGCRGPRGDRATPTGAGASGGLARSTRSAAGPAHRRWQLSEQPADALHDGVCRK
jgi:replicative DNA helicase